MIFSDIFDRYITPLSPVPSELPPSGSPRHPIKAVLFDVYGTLLISASGELGGIRETDAPADNGVFPDSHQAIVSLAADFNVPTPPEQLLKAYAGAVEKEHLKMKKQGVDFPEVQIDQIWRRILGTPDINRARQFALAFELIINPVYPMPHLMEMLSRMNGVGIKKRGIISNAQFYTPLMFEYFCGDLPEHLGFDPALLIWSYRMGRAKPSEQLFDSAGKTLSEFGVRPENILFMGNDMLNDVYPAYTRGFQTALFAGDKRSLRLRKTDPRCRDLQPDMIVTDLLQLPGMTGS